MHHPLHPQTKTKTHHLSLDRKDDRESGGMCDDEWRPVWVACCEPEERWVGDKIHEWAGPDHDRLADHRERVVLFSVP